MSIFSHQVIIQNHLNNYLPEYKNKTILTYSHLGGMTNHNYLVSYADGEKLVVRIPGAKTESIINRHSEQKNSLLTANVGLNVKTLVLDPHSGIKITQYLENCETLTHDSVKNPAYLIGIAQRLKQLHHSNLQFDNRFDLFQEYQHYWDEIQQKSVIYQLATDFDHLAHFFCKLKQRITAQRSQLAPCHNDLVPENCLVQNNTISFIDWEYSGMNDPLFDLAAFFLESQLNEKEKALVLSHYLDTPAEQDDAMYWILAYQFCQDMLWFLWTILKEENHESFGDYALNRINRARMLRQQLLDIGGI